MTTRSSNVRDTSDGPSNVKSQQAGSVQDLKIMRVMAVGSQVWVLVGEKPGKLPATEQFVDWLTHIKRTLATTRIAQINPFQGLTIYVEAS